MNRLEFISSNKVKKKAAKKNIEHTIDNLFDWVNVGDQFNYQTAKLFNPNREVIIKVQVLGIDVKNKRLFVMHPITSYDSSSNPPHPQIMLLMGRELYRLGFIEQEPIPMLNYFGMDLERTNEQTKFYNRKHLKSERAAKSEKACSRTQICCRR